MRHKSFFLFTLLCLSLLTISSLPYVYGCGGIDYSYRDSPYEMVSNEITFFPSDFGYDRLFTAYQYYAAPGIHDVTEDDTTTNPSPTFEEKLATTNLEEWNSFFEKRLTKEELKKFVYGLSSKELKAAEQLILTDKPLGKLDNTVFRVFLRNKAYLPALDYMIYAKECQYYAEYTGDEWDVTEALKKLRNPVAMQKLINQGMKTYSSVKSPFLRMRYAFQIVRLANYAGFYKDCVRYYDTLIPHNVNSIYLYEAMRHKAGALHRIKDDAGSLGIISLVFDQSIPHMELALREFYPPGPDEWHRCLEQHQNKHHQATLWFMWSLKDEEEDRLNLEPVMKLYELEPKSSRSENALVRYINKLEKTLLVANDFSTNPSIESKKRGYIEDALNFIEKVDLASVRTPTTWELAAGYLNILLKHFDNAEAWLAKADTASSKDERVKAEVQLLRGIAMLAQADTISPKLESTLLPTLVNLSLWKKDYNKPLIYRSFLLLMAEKYLSNNQLAKAYCCIDKSGYTNMMTAFLEYSENPGVLDPIIAFLGKPAKTPYEDWLTGKLNMSLGDLYYCKGTKLLLGRQYAPALACYEKVPATTMAKYDVIPVKTSFEQNYYNPKTGLNRFPKGFVPYKKLNFVKKVNFLLAKAEQEPEKADLYYYQIGNGFFHTPAWSYYNLDMLSYDCYYFGGYPNQKTYPSVDRLFTRGEHSYYGGAYIKKEIAWYFYEKALINTKNPELAARCAFMAAACQTRYSLYDAFVPKEHNRAYYYRLLKNKYGKTKYYQNVFKECATLRKYLRSH
ncbi:MAG TPA: hypothetical protein VHR47_04890 [Bacillota bacterium]|nr:hypothetical protein [Bacillota bacterium]